MFFRPRTLLAQPVSILSFALNECASNARMTSWATLTIHRPSLQQPWSMSVFQRKQNVYLKPLPEELFTDSSLAKYFISEKSVPTTRAIRILSVNGIPATLATDLRKELNQSHTAVLQLALNFLKSEMETSARAAAAELGEMDVESIEAIPVRKHVPPMTKQTQGGKGETLSRKLRASSKPITQVVKGGVEEPHSESVHSAVDEIEKTLTVSKEITL